MLFREFFYLLSALPARAGGEGGFGRAQFAAGACCSICCCLF